MPSAARHHPGDRAGALRARRARAWRLAGSLAVALAWCFSLGLQWPMLQFAAWIKMAAENRQAMGWMEAVETAVTGPKCAMCLAIEDAQVDSKEPDAAALNPAEGVFFVALPPAGDEAIDPPQRRWTWRAEREEAGDRHETPPVPPPRARA